IQFFFLLLRILRYFTLIPYTTLFRSDLHKTILESFNGLFTDLDNNLKKHLDEFQLSVDRNESAIIKSDYLKDTEEDISDDYEKLDRKSTRLNSSHDSISYAVYYLKNK